ncbi:MAG: twin-arginine translocase TatA/TatE family subunit [Patescibacteria group bacterium]
MPRIGATEIIVISLLVILFFGTRKLPEFIKDIGEAIKKFKEELQEKK